DVSPIPGEILPPELLVLDLIYSRTRLLREAEAAGCVVADGELMLLHQGAAAFTLWTGRPAPVELMQQALATARAGGVRSAEREPAGDDPLAVPASDGAAGEGAAAPGAAGEGAPAGEA